jgi:hypothetical protein
MFGMESFPEKSIFDPRLPFGSGYAGEGPDRILAVYLIHHAPGQVQAPELSFHRRRLHLLAAHQEFPVPHPGFMSPFLHRRRVLFGIHGDVGGIQEPVLVLDKKIVYLRNLLNNTPIPFACFKTI